MNNLNESIKANQSKETINGVDRRIQLKGSAEGIKRITEGKAVFCAKR